jgi:hypothetical protein
VRVDLDDELERLYAAEPGAFVGSRDLLVRSLRAEGRRAEAAQVAGLRRPALAAWVVNQLARSDRRSVDLLLDAGHRLISAQQALLAGGDPAPFDEARARERAALERLRAEAQAILGERASPELLERVLVTLRAAAVSAPHREELARGRLPAEVAPTGFEALAALAGLPAAPAGGKPAPAAAEQRERRGARAQEAAKRRAITSARKQLESARALETTLARASRRAERALAAAHEQLAAAEQTLEAARAELATEEARLEELRAEREAAAGATAAARLALERAQAP